MNSINHQVYQTANDCSYLQVIKSKTLIKFLHFVANDEIKRKKEHFDVFSKSQVSLLKKKFEKKKLVQQFLKEERKVKITALQKLAPILPQLLYALFNET